MTAKPKEAPAPEQDDDTRWVELPDGSRLRMLPMTWQMMKAASYADPNAPNESLGELMSGIEGAVVEEHFTNGRPLKLQPSTRFMEIFREWNKTEDNASLPPANGQPSATPS